MSCQEQQEEELEVLESIYDGDAAFNQIKPTVFQYKIGEDRSMKSFLLEVTWGDDYPDSMPTINMDTFYNKHLLDPVKASVVEKLTEEAEAFLGCAMTYTLFEYAKENVDDLLMEQPDQVYKAPVVKEPKEEQQSAKPKFKKEQLTKSQKRKIVSRLDKDGELPRGHDWVDVIKHLCQIGRGAEQAT